MSDNRPLYDPLKDLSFGDRQGPSCYIMRGNPFRYIKNDFIQYEVFSIKEMMFFKTQVMLQGRDYELNTFLRVTSDFIGCPFTMTARKTSFTDWIFSLTEDFEDSRWIKFSEASEKLDLFENIFEAQKPLMPKTLTINPVWR